MTVNWDTFKVRCSKISSAMAENVSARRLTELQIARRKELEDKDARTSKQDEELALLRLKEEKSKEVLLSTTYIEYLMEVYAWETEGMLPVDKEVLDQPALRKGKEGEDKAILLLSIVSGDLYKKHKDRISNDYLSGEIDCYLGNDINSVEVVDDVKISFDYPTYLKKLHTGLVNGQKEQVQGYMDILQSPKGNISNCLVTMSDEQIDDQKYRYLRKLNCATDESPEFLEKWGILERSMRFDHIDPRLRVNQIPIEPMSEITRQNLYDQVKRGRNFLNKFHEERLKLVN